MNPDEVNAATVALTQAVKDSAIQQGNTINTQAGELAPGLATGSNAPGGYNYQRTIAPIVDPLAANMVVAAKQAVLRQALKDAQHVAKVNYEDANYGFKGRQREYYKKQALEARARQARADAMAAGGGGTVASGSAGSNVTGVNATGSSNQFIGSNDVRGRLAWLAKNGDTDAATALKYVGNDGKFGSAPLAAKGSMEKFGFTGNYASGGGGGGSAPAARPYQGFQLPTLRLSEILR